MISQPKRATAPVEQTAVDFYDFTRRLLVDARQKRELSLLRRAKIRIDGDRFKALSDDRQEDLLELYGAAMMATGMGAP